MLNKTNKPQTRAFGFFLPIDGSTEYFVRGFWLFGEGHVSWQTVETPIRGFQESHGPDQKVLGKGRKEAELRRLRVQRTGGGSRDQILDPDRPLL